MGLSKTINGVLKYAFMAADQNRSNDLDLKEFEYLLDRLGIRVSHKGSELLFRAILSQHNKRFLGFYEFKMAFMVTNPLQFIRSPKDLDPAKVLRAHIRQYFETVAAEHRANRRKVAEIAWGLFCHDKAPDATMNLHEFREGVHYLGLGALSQEESQFMFGALNPSNTGLIKKTEFLSAVRKDIPVSLSKVVNVKDILYDVFERILLDFTGHRTPFPQMNRTRSIVNRATSSELIFQSQQSINRTLLEEEVKGKKANRDSIWNYGKDIGNYSGNSLHRGNNTVKAPLKSPFGSSIAEMAETGSTMMDDIIFQIEDPENGKVRKETEAITADEFRQLFSHSFVRRMSYSILVLSPFLVQF